MEMFTQNASNQGPGGGSNTATVYCPANHIAVGGGGWSSGSQIGNQYLRGSRPTTSQSGLAGWEAMFSGTNGTRTAYVLCAPTS